MTGDERLRVSASSMATLHTLLVFSGFFGALACVLSFNKYYLKVVKNEFFGYPEEWFPSVSASIGDLYPARNLFQVCLAFATGPRAMLILLNHLLTLPNDARLAKITTIVGCLRLLGAMIFIFITSTDDHDAHDVGMIVYLVFTLAWYILTLKCVGKAPPTEATRKSAMLRKRFIFSFIGLIPILIHLFVRHKVKQIPGAYSQYAYAEWCLILIDVGFDMISWFELQDLDLVVTKAKEPSTTSALTWSPKFSRMGDVILGMVFWTLWTALPAAVWYFPLWSMGLSGHEASVILYMAPVLLGIPSFKKFVKKNLGWFHLASLGGLASFAIASPQNRLLGTGIGVALTSIAWFTQIHYATDGTQFNWTIAGWILGLFLHNIVKYAGYSSNPFWTIKHGPSGGWNVFGIFLGLLASLEMIWHPRNSKRDKEVSTVKISPFLAGTGLAGALFSVMHLAVDFGIINRWSTEGYPRPVAEPALWAVVTMAFMMVGLGLAMDDMEDVEKLLASNGWLGFGTVCILCLYFVPHAHVAYLFGLLYLLWLFSVLPRIASSSLGQDGLGMTLTVYSLWFMLMLFGSVWPVAYEFVPGGVYLRERTWILVLVTQMMIGAGLSQARLIKPQPSRVIASVVRIARQLFYLLLFLTVVRVAQWKKPQPHHPEQRLLTGGIWTVHFGLDQEGYESHRRMANLIRELELDVVGLLESDLTRIIMGNRDMSQYLGETLNYYVDYGPNPIKHTWGCTLLSKFPIKRSHHHLLPSPVGELACAIHATLDVYGREVDVIVSHNGQEENLQDRRLQTDALAKISQDNNGRPLLFLGYVVTKPGLEHEIYKRLIGDGGLQDIDSTDWDRWCEYIAFKHLDRVGYARVSHGGITDTEMQVGKFIVPESKEHDRTRRCKETEVDAALRFPTLFRGQGVRGHRYHVFDEPRYYCQ